MVNISCAAVAVATAACSTLGSTLPQNASQPAQLAALAGFGAKYGGVDALGFQAPLHDVEDGGGGTRDCPTRCFSKGKCLFTPNCKLCCGRAPPVE
ncbi:hypothetical protein PsYK624_011350 [Phanerochaete sordida]|uniref:Uncharacterized protein n=1 Tax=Phanerochaete sordida TaxID=48140 RepID=A0A9P3FYS2_9APHY|nr:hypothetical protein PsYK624_011350 [Phanerochaete sordida]